MGRKQITHCAFCNKPGHWVPIARLPLTTVSCFDHSVLRLVNADRTVCGLCVAAADWILCVRAGKGGVVGAEGGEAVEVGRRGRRG